MNCKTVLLKDLVLGEKGSYGIGAPAVDYDPKKYTYLRITDINDDGSINTNGLKSVDAEDAYKYVLQENDIVFARTGASTGKTYFYQPQDGTLVYAGFLIKFSIDPRKVNPRLLKYITHSQEYYNWVRSFDTGGTRGNINAVTFANMPITLPNRATQDKIVAILSSLDDKIELNRRINANLEQQAQALYKSWFVDDKKDDWEEKRLDDIISIYDSQRKPLSGQQREKMEKLYPYYGAASLMDYVDNYLFDGIYLLLGEDGTVSDSEGFPMLQYVWGKFWVNNHAHILQGKNGFTTESLCILLKQTNVSSIVTGAVQPKISQANLKSVPIIMPPINLLNQYNDIIKPLFDQIRTNHNQIQQLSTLRDTLLPKLMNGEITV